MHYLKEEKLYNYWKLVERAKEDKLIIFVDLCAVSQSVGLCVSNVVNFLTKSGILLKNLKFDKDNYLFWTHNGEEIFSATYNNLSGEYTAKTSLNKVYNNQFDENDLINIILINNKIDLLSYINFKLSDEDVLKIEKMINAYLEMFINDELVISDKNHYIFNKQKEGLYLDLNRHYKDGLGKNFIMKPFPFSSSEFLFIHSLFSFNYLEYITIEDIYVNDFLNEKETDDYKVKVKLNESFFNLMDNKKVLRENNDIVLFSSEEGRINLESKIIEIRKTSKQYDVLRLLFTAPGKDWQFSEILEELDPLDDNWKRIYDIVGAVNRKVAIETGIKDFFITTTQSVKINSKYLKKS